MNQTRFEQLYEKQWHDFDTFLDGQKGGAGKARLSEITAELFPVSYRRICNHYSLAKSRHYSPALVDRLHDLVLRGHHQLYQRKTSFLWHGIIFISSDFPRAVRSASPAFWLAFLLFFGPASITGVLCYNDPVFIYRILEEGQVQNMESMYADDKVKLGRSTDREAETDFAMFGYYIWNNISIGFRTFAGGMVFGAGTVVLLLFNGSTIGAVAGHLSHPPYSQIFWQFVPGHGAFELTAIVICGTAGLLLGRSLLLPGKHGRLDSLRLQAPKALHLVMGAAVMLVCAALIEAFWSSSRLDPAIKYIVAAVNWLLVAVYLLFCGRGRRG